MNPSQNNSIDYFLGKLFARIDYERNVPDSAKNFDLSKMRELMECLGNPERSYPVIHVAGTKGKGSVSVMAGAMLTAAGMKTGVYTSPHLETIHQRFAIDGVPITDRQLIETFASIDPQIDAFDRQQLKNGGQPVSFFEYTTALAFAFFANEHCNAVVLETGLGGRLDSTNVCRPEVCIITNISLDHTRLLGDTVEKIAAEKGGIIKPYVPVINGTLQPGCRNVIETIAQERGSKILHHGEAFSNGPCTTDGRFQFTMPSVEDRSATVVDGIKLKMPGQHQRANAALAIAALMVLRHRGWRISDDAIRTGLSTAMLPGRTEIVGQNPVVLMDLAHNTASIGALVELLENELPAWKSSTKKTLVFGTTRDKDCRGMLELLLPLFDHTILTQYKNNPRGMKPKKLSEISASILEHESSQPTVETIDDPVEAWATARRNHPTDSFVCIAGSAFLIAEIRARVLAHVQTKYVQPK